MFYFVFKIRILLVTNVLDLLGLASSTRFNKYCSREDRNKGKGDRNKESGKGEG